MMLRKLLAILAAGAFAALGSVSVALAAPVAAIVVTDATMSLENQIPSMTAVLTSVLGLSALVMAFAWIRKVMR